MTTSGAPCEEPAEVEDDRSLGELDDGAHHVLDPQDRHPELVPDVPDDLDRGGELRIVEAGHHLVEQQHPRLPRERLRQLEEPQLMEVQLDRLAGSLLQLHERQRLGRAPPRLSLADDAVSDAEHRAEENVLEDRQRAEGERLLHGHRDSLAPDLMSGETVDPLTVEPDAAVCRPLQPDDDLQERALRPCSDRRRRRCRRRRSRTSRRRRPGDRRSVS